MSIASIDLNLLFVLHTVLCERSVVRAAEKLHVTPSAVSNALARLREALHDPLVTRKGRGIVPTPRAAELAPALARAMRELEHTLVARAFDAASCTRTFTLAVGDVGQVAWVPKLSLAMLRELPRAQLRVVGIESLISLGNLSAAEIEVHVGIAAKMPGLHVELLLEEPTLLVARRRHAAAGRKLSRRTLAELRHVRVEMVPGKNFRDPFAAVFERAGISRVIAVTVPSYSAAAEVVAASDLVTMLPAALLHAKGQSLGLRALVTPLPAHATRLVMSWHERTHTDPAASAFRALIRGVIVQPI